MKKILQGFVLCLVLSLLPLNAGAGWTTGEERAFIDPETGSLNELGKKVRAANMLKLEEAKKRALTALTEATEVTLFSLVGGRYWYPHGSTWDHKKDEEYGSYKAHLLFGKIALTDKEAKTAANAFRLAIESSDGTIGKCWVPYYALTIKANGHTYDYFISYECHRIEISEDGRGIPTLSVYGDSTALDKLLDAHNIPRKKHK